MKPKTTTKRPTKPGYYWYKDSLTPGWIIIKVFFYYNSFHAEGEDVAFEYNQSELQTDDEIWSLNPINPPK